jgi:hypothetical protein
MRKTVNLLFYLFLFGVLHNIVNNLDYTVLNGWMVSELYELGGSGRKQLWCNLRYCPRIYVEGLRETMQNHRIVASVPPKIRTGITLI